MLFLELIADLVRDSLLVFDGIVCCPPRQMTRMIKDASVVGKIYRKIAGKIPTPSVPEKSQTTLGR